MRSRKMDRNKESLIEALIYVPPQVNRLAFVKGYSPCQWVFGTNPAMAQMMSDDRMNVVTAAAADDDDIYKEICQKREAAQAAFLKADASSKLRRALLRRHVTYQRELVVGQRSMVQVVQLSFWFIGDSIVATCVLSG